MCEKLRYSEIRREMYNITDAVLAATLKDLTESVWVIVKPKVWEEDMMNVRIADLKDFEKIMKIYKYAQDYMIQSGNPTQWGHLSG